MSGVVDVDVVVVGAGFAGLYTHYRLRQLGVSIQGFEAAGDVGGTWWWNRYPGARCDIESMDYSYSFSKELDQEWDWSERYAAQPEILRYIDHVADRFDLRRDIRFDTRVTSATWVEPLHRWEIATDRGDRVRGQFLVMATGCLSAPKEPEIEGIDTFAGPTYHTGRWPHEPVDLTGQRVGVIGTGSSGIQAIPVMAEQAAHLYVFQRTPNFSVPAHNGPLDPEFVKDRKANYPEHRQEMRKSRSGFVVNYHTDSALSVGEEDRQSRFYEGWESGILFGLFGSFVDLVVNPEANEYAAEFVRDRIRETVQDQGVAELLSPRSYPFGTKRLCMDTNYYATYNRPDVTLVDVSTSPIEAVTPTGLRTADAEYELDTLVFATGFDAMTGPLLGPDINGVAGLALREKWVAGPRAYLGLTIAGFPNLFMITGPGSPSVLANMILGIEQHVDWVANCIDHLRSSGRSAIEPTLEAEDGWVDHVNEMANRTLFPKANSWYVGANVPGKPRVFMPYVGGLKVYGEAISGVAADDYRGFVLV